MKTKSYLYFAFLTTILAMFEMWLSYKKDEMSPYVMPVFFGYISIILGIDYIVSKLEK